MRQSLLVANWKLHGTRSFVTAWLTAMKSKMVTMDDGVQPQVIILPPAIFLQQVAELLKDTSLAWGSQILSDQLEGAYTGEISGLMLKEFGCQYVLIGHSERRRYYGEQGEQILQKLKQACQAGLTPILCIGETLDHYQRGKTQAILYEQLQPLWSLEPSMLSRIVLAYEPVWAIGTGLQASPDYVQSVHAQLRQYLAQQRDTKLAHKVRILYGGSLKPDNAKALFAMPDIDGGLVGGAALIASDFLAIYQALV